MHLPTANYWAWDIETAENGQITDYPTMLSSSNGKDAFVAIGERNIRDLACALRDSGSQLVTWNGWAFDEPKMKNWGIEMPASDDAMAMAYLDDETQALGLESCAVKYLGVPAWKGKDWNEFNPNALEDAEYAARDAKYTYMVYQVLRRNLGDRMRTLRRILSPSWKSLYSMSERGIFIDSKAVAREREAAERARDSSLRSLCEDAGPEFNPNSPKQVGEYLHSKGVALPLTDSGKRCTSVAVLNEITHPFAKNLVAYRQATKTLGTYVAPYESIVQSGGRVHPTYTILRTLTGRSSARNTNVQNLPKQYKDFFGAQPGKVLIEADFSAIEFRVAAWFARERVILTRYQDDSRWDPHKFFASRYYDKLESEVTKEERSQAKVQFGLLYLGNAFTLDQNARKQGIFKSMTEWHMLFQAFHLIYPDFRPWYAEVKEEIIRTGQAACPTGHIRHFGDFTLLPDKLKLEALRQAVNVKVQNLAAHIAYIAMAECERIGLAPVGFVHDSLLFECNPEDVEGSLRSIEYAMTRHPPEFLKNEFDIDFDIPLAIETKVSPGNDE